MEKKEYLTNMQIMLLVIFCNISTALFFVPGEAVGEAFQDAWLSIILATVITSLLSIYPLAQMGISFPRRTIIQYSQEILGKAGGRLAGFLLIYSFFMLHTWTLREFSEIGIVFLPETPFITFFIVLSLVATFAALQGIEVIGRCAQFIFPIGFMILILVDLMNMWDIRIDNLRPVLEISFPTLIRSILSPLDWVSTGVALGVIAAYSNRPQGLIKWGMMAIGASGLILCLFSILLLSVFGPVLLGNANYPLLMLAAYGRMGSLEALIVAVWFAWIFIRTTLYAYVTSIGICHLFELKDLRSIILGEAVLATAYSFHQYASFLELSYLFSIAHLYYQFFQIFVPLIIWIIFLIRKKSIINSR